MYPRIECCARISKGFPLSSVKTNVLNGRLTTVVRQTPHSIRKRLHAANVRMLPYDTMRSDKNAFGFALNYIIVEHKRKVTLHSRKAYKPRGEYYSTARRVVISVNNCLRKMADQLSFSQKRDTGRLFVFFADRIRG